MSETHADRIDRTDWPPGPWDRERDLYRWHAHGFPCLMVRANLGNWCGYVAVPPGHPWHSQHYDALAVDVHGGLTYADECQAHICHVPRPGEPDDVWWLGFDCCHAGDLAPRMLAIEAQLDLRRARRVPRSDVYRSAGYVRRQVTALAVQALEASHGAK